MGKSTIEWTERTWNPTRGCSIVSPGCHHCYAMRQAHRFNGPGMPYEGLTKASKAGPVWTGTVLLDWGKLDEPARRREPSIYFVNSMSDLFHEGLLNEEIAVVFDAMARAPQHVFQVLTKRAARMERWVCEYGNLCFNPSSLDWVIVGGESGPGARAMDIVWARDIVRECQAANVPVFMKQLGANPFDSDRTERGQSESLRLIDRNGGDPHEWPESLRVRQMPRST